MKKPAKEAESPKGSVDTAVESYAIPKMVSEFLYMIADNTSGEKSERDAKNELIRKLFREGFEIHDPSRTKKIGSKVLQQALWRVMSKVKFLDCVIHGTGEDEDTERLVTEGVTTVANRGGMATAFRDKAGVFMNAFLFGDGFLLMMRGENDDYPVSYRVVLNENVYADSFSYGVRGVNPSNKMCIILQFDKEEGYELFPNLAEQGAWGRIPGSYKRERSDSDQNESDVLEVCLGWNKAMRRYVIFGGTQCYLEDAFTGEEYPFIKNKRKGKKKSGKPFIPLFQFLCQPSIDMFWNHGIGEMLFDLAVVTAKLLNLEVGHIEENVYPITLINAPQKKVDELIEKMAMAHGARAQGMKPVVAMEFDPNGGQQSVAAQALLTQNLLSEWQAVWDALYREFSRLGINLDDIERGNGITRGQVIAEEQASNAFIMQMMEYNGSETQELLECTMQNITEFVSVKNSSPLNLMTRIRLPDGGSSRLDKEITMGMLSKTLKDGNWFVIPDTRTGAIPSDLTKMVYEERQIAMTPQGSPEYNELYRRINMRRGIDMTLSSPQATPQPGSVPGEEPQMQPQPAASTQRVLPDMSGDLAKPV